MGKVYLASSALKEKGFEGQATVEAAVDSRFEGAQLFLDTRYRDHGYRLSMIDTIQHSGLNVIWHLPNRPLPEDLQAMQHLGEAFPKTRALIHYVPETALPKVHGVRIGWENSDSTRHNPDHINLAFQKAVDDRTFFAYDFGRSFVAERYEFVRQIVIFAFILHMFSRLDSRQDILHAVDKSGWEKSFRENQVPLGQGITKHIMKELRGYAGITVLEYEDLEIAKESFLRLRVRDK